jgi:ACS family hexuronate transporter-like MFS transporter
MDRQVIAYLKEFFCTDVSKGGFGWTNSDFAYVTSFFTAFYAGMTILAGFFIDKIGTKIGLAASLIIWSVFGIANAFVGGTLSLHVAMRSFFGLGEAGNFPASIKTVAEWFPKKERALATGVFNSGSNLGAMISALFVPWCIAYFGMELGWKMAFIITGAVGFIWLIFWFTMYHSPSKHPKLSKVEYDYIHSDDMHLQNNGQPVVASKISWGKLFSYKQTWAFFFGKFMTDGIWFFYLFWLPDFLKKLFHMTTLEVRWPCFIVYGIAILGSIFGGSLPMMLINRGFEPYKARMTAMLLIAFVPLIVLTVPYFGNVDNFHESAMYYAVAIIAIAAAGHQAWSANLFTTVSDMFPKNAVGSVTGIGVMAGGLGGVTIQLLTGKLTDLYKDNPQHAYLIMFIICAFAYVTAWSIMKTLVPKHKAITH